MNDAVQKVAEALLAADLTARLGYQPHGWSDRVNTKHYLERAEYLLAAFPQLTLEGREEWGVAGRDQDGYDWTTEAELLTRDDAETFMTRNAWVQEANGHVEHRTVWESPWVEVQS